MGQWVKPGQLRPFISSHVLKSLACEFQLGLEKGGPSAQNLYTIKSERRCASKGAGAWTFADSLAGLWKSYDVQDNVVEIQRSPAEDQPTLLMKCGRIGTLLVGYSGKRQCRETSTRPKVCRVEPEEC
jgi:hypothetical protein